MHSSLSDRRSVLAIQRVAKRVRHAPGLERLEPLWNLLRRPYHRVIGFGGGAPVNLGGQVMVRMPAEYTGRHSWDGFEPETVRAVADWVAAHPGGAMLDVGCSYGVFSLLALTVSPSLRVVAFDSDAASVKAAGRMCARLGAGRLDLVHGFVSDGSTIPGDLAAAAGATARAIASDDVRADVEAVRFRNLQDGPDVTAGVQTRTLDQLRLEDVFRDRPVLLKCDVEGAELHVLRGAGALLRALAPTLVLSVHPHHLEQLGHRVDEVRELVEAHGYATRVIAVDHEEHWWCEPGRAGRPT